MYSNISYGTVFYCVLIFYCFDKRISVSPKPGIVYPKRVHFLNDT